MRACDALFDALAQEGGEHPLATHQQEEVLSDGHQLRASRLSPLLRQPLLPAVMEGHADTGEDAHYDHRHQQCLRKPPDRFPPSDVRSRCVHTISIKFSHSACKDYLLIPLCVLS